MVHGLISLAKSVETGPINLGNPEEISILDLSDLIRVIFKDNTPPIFLAEMKDDPKQRLPDITLARERLGWTPTVSLASGLNLIAM
jgi:nucleoside-diphosphate-sugar epimerase